MKVIGTRLVTIWFLVFLVISSMSFAEERRREGQFISVTGAVKIQPPGDEKPHFAKAGDLVYAKDYVLTSADSKAEILLDDGSKIFLQADSRIQITDSRTNATHSSSILMIMGWLKALVAPEEVSSLEVQTATAVAGVRGTSFTMAAAADASTRVGVEQGKVWLGSQGQSLTLESRQQSAIELGQKEMKLQAYDPEKVDWTGWMSERAQRMARNADRLASEMDKELEKRHRRAQRYRKELETRYQDVQNISEQMEKDKDKPELYQKHKNELKVALMKNYSQVRQLQDQDNFLAANHELLKHLFQEAQEHPERYSPEMRQKLAEIQTQVKARGIDKIREANQTALQDYTSKLEALVAEYEMGRELQQREYFEKWQNQFEEWEKKRREFEEKYRPKN
jgi:hypothetical protein